MSGRQRQRARVVTGIVAALTLSAACSSSPIATGAPSPPSSARRSCVPRVVTSEATLPPDSGQSDAMAFAQQRHAPLDAAAQARLDRQLADARAIAARYPTVAEARRAGYVLSSDAQPGSGAHWTNWAAVKQCGFDPSRASQLLYRGTGDAARLVALSYYVVSEGRPPAGFAGPNDVWHQHLGLCIRAGVNLGLVSKVGFTFDQCRGRGGDVLDGRDLWMLHVWVVPGYTNPWGVFASANPNLLRA